MHLTTDEFLALNEESLKEFLCRELPEDHFLDYKEQLSGDSKDAKSKEFLKDVTGFANANGGTILIGVLEPKAGLSVDEQVVGLENGADIQKQLEHLFRDCIEPKVSGVIVKPIPLTSNKSVVVIQIPPSLGKPHMVKFKKHRTFYIRHSEGTMPMDTHQIRETVLKTASAEDKAILYLIKMEKDLIKYERSKQESLLVIQAMPIIAPEVPWDVLSEEMRNRVWNHSGSYAQWGFGLNCMHKPRPSLDGIRGQETQENEIFSVHVHRNGYIAVCYKHENEDNMPDKKRSFHKEFGDFFDSFCELCTDLISITQNDVPYLMSCKYHFALNTYFCQKEHIGYNSYGPFGKRTMTWPEQIRQPGEDFQFIADRWFEGMYHAFELEAPSR
ncbi:MAG: hypothetical protein NPINA01_06420 [Nitrospinaceae bacterium]|nr:MAG: hypothetical protein NPINA01_06420 [Nitrospinaceae bacterium]